MTISDDLKSRFHTERKAIDESPACVYGRVTREMLEQVQRDLSDIKGRINVLLFGFAAAVVLDFVGRLIG